MNTLSQNKTLLLKLLQQGKLSEAQQQLQRFNDIPETDSLIKAEILFLNAKVEIYSGKYLKAIGLLEASVFCNPANITALCDLALCQYQLGLYGVLDETLNKVKKLIQDQVLTSEVQDTIDNSILISKLMSEQGRAEEALMFLDHLPYLSITSKQTHSLDIQRLRLLLECGDPKTAQKLYTKVLGGIEHTLNFEVEREHCLLLSDSQLMGIPQALDRFKYLMDQDLLLEDRYFLSSEMVEQLILAGNFELLKDFKLNIDSENEYEKSQARIVQAYLKKESALPVSYVRLEKILSPMNLIRLMRQVLVLFPDMQEFEKISDKYRFYCAQLPSKKMTNMFQQFLIKPVKDLKVVANSSSKLVSIDGKNIAIKNALFWNLLTLFQGNKKDISIEEAIEHLYQETPNLQHFDRLRIGISRLNQNIKQSSNVEAVFKVSKSSVSLLLKIEEQAS